MKRNHTLETSEKKLLEKKIKRHGTRKILNSKYNIYNKLIILLTVYHLHGYKDVHSFNDYHYERLVDMYINYE